MRIASEAFYCQHALFVTLTFRDEDLHKAGERGGGRHETFRQYMQNLRRAGYKVKFVASYELGERTDRPHYHAILLFDAAGKRPDFPLNVRTDLPHWTHGASQYELPRSKSGMIQYTLGYVAKGGGSVLRPSNGIGKRFLMNYADLMAKEKRHLWVPHKGREAMRVLVPGVTIKAKGIDGNPKPRVYDFTMSHPYSKAAIEVYRASFLDKWGYDPPMPQTVTIDDVGIDELIVSDGQL